MSKHLSLLWVLLSCMLFLEGIGAAPRHHGHGKRGRSRREVSPEDFPASAEITSPPEDRLDESKGFKDFTLNYVKSIGMGKESIGEGYNPLGTEEKIFSRDSPVQMGVLSKMKKLFPPLKHFSLPSPTNYQNERPRNPPFTPEPTSQIHFPYSSRERAYEPFQVLHDHSPVTSPHSLNQLLRIIYEHHGSPQPPLIVGYDNVAYSPPMSSPKYVNAEKKSAATNSGYICHFKLCQFGTSGKRLYNPGKRSQSGTFDEA